jgi:hypothetical protein
MKIKTRMKVKRKLELRMGVTKKEAQGLPGTLHQMLDKLAPTSASVVRVAAEVESWSAVE